MSNKFDLTALFERQAILDKTIADNHNITYSSTRTRRTLALLVEIGEFANSTRCFKYWSNKPSEEKERVLDEYADGLHFFLSLGIDIKSTKNVYEVSRNDGDLSSQIVEAYALIAQFTKTYSENDYETAFGYFLNIASALNFTIEDVKNAYFSKSDENFNRQKMCTPLSTC